MSNPEIDKLQILKTKLDQAITQGAKRGDLTPASTLQKEIETRIATIRENFDPFFNLHPNLKKLVKSGERQTFTFNLEEKTQSQLASELRSNARIIVTDIGQSMVESPSFTISPHLQIIHLISLAVVDLGFLHSPTTEELYQAALHTYNLKLCPPAVGPLLRLQYLYQPANSSIHIAMEPIFLTTPNKNQLPFNFHVNSYNRQLWLDGQNTSRNWSLNSHFLFAV